MLTRSAENLLSRWFGRRRRKPLVVRGARQVGKSTLVREFAAHSGLVLNEVNLERHLALEEVFNSLDVAAIMRELEVLSGKPIRAKRSLLFLDEIQAIPRAVQALRYIYEEMPQLPVIAAGSLLEFALADHSFPMPVGRIHYLHLDPMSFREFLTALDPELNSHLSKLDPSKPFPVSAHERLQDRQRQFMFVGGMPEAVHACTETGSLQDISDVHRSITETYLDDFSKYARKKELALLQRVFRFIPRNLGRKVKYTNFSREDRAKDVRDAISLLTKARVCHPVHHTSSSGLPLLAEISENNYKLIFLDIGLVNHVCGNDWLGIRGSGARELINEGGLAEQFIGQHLIHQWDEFGPPRLTYWLREGRSTNAEVDYVWSRGDWIVPVEVKAGKSGSLRSLLQFVLHKKPKITVRFDLNPASLQRVSHTTRTGQGTRRVTYTLLSLPLYAVEELPRLIDDFRAGRINGNNSQPNPRKKKARA
ncbi:ATP-binding protein [Acidobacteriota bacterium]